MRDSIRSIPRREAIAIVVVTATVMAAMFALELLVGLFGFVLIV